MGAEAQRRYLADLQIHRAVADSLATARPEPRHPSVAEAAPRVGKATPELETLAKDAGLDGYRRPLPGDGAEPSSSARATAASVQRELGVGFNQARRIADERNRAGHAALPPELQEIEAMRRGGDFLPEDAQTLADGEAEAQRAESYALGYETLVNCVLRNAA